MEELYPYLYTLAEEDAARHLFRVAAGLESMIVGEYEVLGQVREALEEAESSDLAACPLKELFQQAVSVGRQVRKRPKSAGTLPLSAQQPWPWRRSCSAIWRTARYC